MKSSLPQVCPADPGAAKRWRREAFPSGKTRRQQKKKNAWERNDLTWAEIDKKLQEYREAKLASLLLDTNYRPGQAGCRR
jgi:hypothetical protein